MSLAAAIASAAVAGSCRVDVPDGALFQCKTDEDCRGGDDRMVCAPRPDAEFGFCCIPSPEICDGKDNDCNGEVDQGIAPESCYEGLPGTAGVGICRSGEHSCAAGQWGACIGQVLPQSESCNGVDDDCDGEIDNGLLGTQDHCAACGNACPSTHQCVARACVLSSEPDCRNGADDDGDGQTDCDDSDCGGRLCMSAPATFTCDATRACTCGGTADPVPPESNCANQLDDDCDGLVDCADPHCNATSCGTGCECRNLERHELLAFCGDGEDNDQDSMIDCADTSDCPRNTPCGPAGQICRPTARCN
jgi:hypothetical protein